jgi:hypothetical protein
VLDIAKIVLFGVLLDAEKGRRVAHANLDTHFIDRLRTPFDIRWRRCSAEDCRMRLNDQQVTCEMRRRITRRCVSAATGACR